MKKRFLVVLMALAMLTGMLLIPAFAAEPADGVTFTVCDENGNLITAAYEYKIYKDTDTDTPTATLTQDNNGDPLGLGDGNYYLYLTKIATGYAVTKDGKRLTAITDPVMMATFTLENGTISNADWSFSNDITSDAGEIVACQYTPKDLAVTVKWAPGSEKETIAAGTAVIVSDETLTTNWFYPSVRSGAVSDPLTDLKVTLETIAVGSEDGYGKIKDGDEGRVLSASLVVGEGDDEDPRDDFYGVCTGDDTSGFTITMTPVYPSVTVSLDDSAQGLDFAIDLMNGDQSVWDVAYALEDSYYGDEANYSNLPKYDGNGELITYTLSLGTVEGYKITCTGDVDNGFTVSAAESTSIPSIPDRDGDDLDETDTDGDGIYEGTDTNKNKVYLPDGEGDYIEVNSDNDGVYEDDKGNKYIPVDTDGDDKYDDVVTGVDGQDDLYTDGDGSYYQKGETTGDLTEVHVHTATVGGKTEYTVFTTALKTTADLAQLPNGGNYYMDADISYEGDLLSIEFDQSNITLDLCMNGHTLTDYEWDTKYDSSCSGTVNITDCHSKEERGTIKTTTGFSAVIGLYAGAVEFNVSNINLYANYYGIELTSGSCKFTATDVTITAPRTLVRVTDGEMILDNCALSGAINARCGFTLKDSELTGSIQLYGQSIAALDDTTVSGTLTIGERSGSYFTIGNNDAQYSKASVGWSTPGSYAFAKPAEGITLNEDMLATTTYGHGINLGDDGILYYVIYSYIDDQDEDSQKELDKDGDGIYEGSKGEDIYLPDGNGGYIEVNPDTDGDGIYEDDEGTRYIPVDTSEPADGKYDDVIIDEVPNDGVYTDDNNTTDDTTDDKYYIHDDKNKNDKVDDGEIIEVTPNEDDDGNPDGTYTDPDTGNKYQPDGEGGIEKVPSGTGGIFIPSFSGGGSSASDVCDQFPDVNTDLWYHDAIHHALTEELMKGYDTGLFGTLDNLNRAMLVQILYRLEGEPAFTTDKSFSDVGDTWYTKAVLWAAENGIVEGYDGKFSPNADITREQLATILYRYARYKGIDVSARTGLSSFADGGKTSSWAKDAAEWAVSAGVIGGKDDGYGRLTLDPTGTATRAEVAQMLLNFWEKILGR